jgi:lipopolysaccharide heptosyltransferase I
LRKSANGSDRIEISNLKLEIAKMSDPRQRFLVIRLSSIGDMVHTLPAVAALGRTYPEAEIHWAVEKRYAGLLAGNPYVHRALELDTLGWRAKMPSASAVEEAVRGILALRQVSYDAAIDFQGLWKSAVLGWLSRSRERLGFAEAWLKEPGAGVLYTEHISAGERKHLIEVNLALVEWLGAHAEGWEFPLPRTPEDDAYVECRLARLGARDFIIVNPGGGWKAKCWAPENYAELLRRVASRLSWKILLTGSPGDASLIAEILDWAGVPQASYFPSTLVQFIALARRARLCVGGDTGPVHLAAAVGTPIVAIHGPTDPARNGPFSAADIALSNRGPVNHTRRAARPAYLLGVSVESVDAAIDQRLARAVSTGAPHGPGEAPG